MCVCVFVALRACECVCVLAVLCCWARRPVYRIVLGGEGSLTRSFRAAP